MPRGLKVKKRMTSADVQALVADHRRRMAEMGIEPKAKKPQAKKAIPEGWEERSGGWVRAVGKHSTRPSTDDLVVALRKLERAAGGKLMMMQGKTYFARSNGREISTNEIYDRLSEH